LIEKSAPDPIRALHGDLPEPPTPPVLAMDSIRIATLIVLACLVVSSIFQGVYLVTSVQQQRVVNECYQDQADQMLSAITVGRQATAQDRAAQLAMLNTLLDPGSSPDARRVAIEGWRLALGEADRTRSLAPVPTQRCAR
jgi:hypothetical protein